MTPDHPAAPPPVLIQTTGRLGRATLNRPRAINALTLEMVRLLDAALTEWEEDDDVTTVLLDGAGDRGLCAGGDIVAFRESALDDGTDVRRFWREEYRLNARIAAYPKPIVVVMDGIVMGGGVGLAGHASHRVTTERLVWSMPEVMIGFAPDVGGTYLLSRAPGALGLHLALTAARIGAEDATACGFADAFVTSGRIPALAEALRSLNADSAVAAAAERPPPSSLLKLRPLVDAVFRDADLPEVVARLRATADPAAASLLAALGAASPTSLAVTLAAVRRARDLPGLAECLEQEYAVSCALAGTPDFVEGIRAAVVDKDRNPRWDPATIDDVDPADVDRLFPGDSVGA